MSRTHINIITPNTRGLTNKGLYGIRFGKRPRYGEKFSSFVIRFWEK